MSNSEQPSSAPTSPLFWKPLGLWTVLGVFVAAQVGLHLLVAIGNTYLGLPHVSAAGAGGLLGVIIVAALVNKRRAAMTTSLSTDPAES